MKHNLLFTILLAVFLLPALPQLSFATDPDTIWTRYWGYEIKGAPEEGFEFHPTNDSIFIYTGRTYINDVKNDTFAVHFVNTVSGQEYKRYGPIHHAHYTPDGNFLIGHNDSTIAYISLDSMKPVRSYPIMKNALGNFTIDEKGKYVYTTGFTDTNKKFGFFRWSIDSGTVEQINLPDSLLQHPLQSCPTTYAVIRKMYASDTAKILLMSVFVNRPEPYCPAETRIWGIDLNADTVKYDFMKLDPSIRSSTLTGILPNRTKFIGFIQKEESAGSFIFDVATGDSIEQIHGIFDINYTFLKDEVYSISFGAVFTPSEDKMIVYHFNNRDTVYTYNNVNVGPIVISPNNEYILQHASVKFVLYPTPWHPTSIAEPREDTPRALIYPNPGTDEVSIEIPPLERGSGGVSVKIYDVLGVEVLSLGDSRFRGNDIFVSDEGNVRIDVSSMPKGVYFVKVGTSMLKFIKI